MTKRSSDAIASNRSKIQEAWSGRKPLQESNVVVVADLFSRAAALAEAAIAKMTPVEGEDLRTRLGIDPRSSCVWVCKDGLAVNSKSAEYYAGLDYVDSEHKLKIAEYAFYSGEDGRVAGHLRTFFRNPGEEDEDDL